MIRSRVSIAKLRRMVWLERLGGYTKRTLKLKPEFFLIDGTGA
jgi:hypothetical protein